MILSPSASSSEVLTREITREITDGTQERRRATIMQPYLIVLLTRVPASAPDNRAPSSIENKPDTWRLRL
jgi:hypothetical protein